MAMLFSHPSPKARLESSPSLWIPPSIAIGCSCPPSNPSGCVYLPVAGGKKGRTTLTHHPECVPHQERTRRSEFILFQTDGGRRSKNLVEKAVQFVYARVCVCVCLIWKRCV